LNQVLPRDVVNANEELKTLQTLQKANVSVPRPKWAVSGKE
jgi:hypothetical protein